MGVLAHDQEIADNQPRQHGKGYQNLTESDNNIARGPINASIIGLSTVNVMGSTLQGPISVPYVWWKSSIETTSPIAGPGIETLVP